MKKHKQLRTKSIQIWDNLHILCWIHLSEQIKNNLRSELRYPNSDQLVGQLSAQLRDQLWDSIRETE